METDRTLLVTLMQSRYGIFGTDDDTDADSDTISFCVCLLVQKHVTAATLLCAKIKIHAHVG